MRIAALVPAYKLRVDEVHEIVNRLSVTSSFQTPLFIFNDDDLELYQELNGLQASGRAGALFLPFQVGKAEAIREGLRHLLQASAAELFVQLDGHLKQPVEIALSLSEN